MGTAGKAGSPGEEGEEDKSKALGAAAAAAAGGAGEDEDEDLSTCSPWTESESATGSGSRIDSVGCGRDSGYDSCSDWCAAGGSPSPLGDWPSGEGCENASRPGAGCGRGWRFCWMRASAMAAASRTGLLTVTARATASSIVISASSLVPSPCSSSCAPSSACRRRATSRSMCRRRRSHP